MDIETESRAKLTIILEDALRVIKTPSEFYRAMPKAGGFSDPIIFLLVMAVAMGLLVAILSLFGAGVIGAMVAGFGAIISVPIFALIGSFIGAAILFVIWKLMGSEQEYETAYRCVAYAAAIYPVTAVLGLVPYVGTIVGVVWGTYLMITASIEVHQLKRNNAFMVFGILGALLLVMNIGSEMAARKMAAQAEKFSEQFEEKFGDIGAQLEDMEEMTPEQAGEALGGFLQGLNEAVQEAQQEGQGGSDAAQEAAEAAASEATEAAAAQSVQGGAGSSEAMTPQEAGKALGDFFSGLEKATREMREQAGEQPTAQPPAEAISESTAEAAGEARAPD